MKSKRKLAILSVIAVFLVGFLAYSAVATNIFAEQESLIPSWIKITAGFWANDQISDNEFINALQYLVDQSILVLPDTTQTIEDTPDKKADILRSETNSKFSDLQELAKDPRIQQALIDSNREFNKIDSVYLLIEERNNEWISADKDEITPFMAELINYNVSELLRKIITEDKKETKYFVYEEIFITNAYGANIAQSGKTTDYKQDDELWWQNAKDTGFNFDSGYDESAGVHSLDISVRIDDENGNFLGVMKSVINIEEIVKKET